MQRNVFSRENQQIVSRGLLGECNLFRGLAAEERAGLIARAHSRRFAPEETIFLRGSAGDSMMVVVTGQVHITLRSADGKEIVLAILGPGEIFGEIAMLDGEERTADAKAATECNLAIFYRRDVLTFFKQNPAAWSNIVLVLCERLRHTDRQIAEMAMLAMPLRLAKALLRMATIGRASGTGHAASQVRLTQRELGNLVGATRESVNKHLGEWQRKGIIQITERLITILNQSALEYLAHVEDAACRGRAAAAATRSSSTHSSRGRPLWVAS
jgi:CRP/FNR family cyclic AMP-dependent transcriptional regulator